MSRAKRLRLDPELQTGDRIIVISDSDEDLEILDDDLDSDDNDGDGDNNRDSEVQYLGECALASEQDEDPKIVALRKDYEDQLETMRKRHRQQLTLLETIIGESNVVFSGHSAAAETTLQHQQWQLLPEWQLVSAKICQMLQPISHTAHFASSHKILGVLTTQSGAFAGNSSW